MFWKEILSWASRYNNDVKNISLPDVFFAKFNTNEDFMIINHTLFLAKFFIYRCKLDKKEPSIGVFKAKLKAAYKLELNVARKNDVLSENYAFISMLS